MSHTIFPTDSAASVIFPATVNRCHIDPEAFLLLPFHFLMSNKLEDKHEIWLRGTPYTFSASALCQHFERRLRGMFQPACISLPVHTLMGQKKNSRTQGTVARSLSHWRVSSRFLFYSPPNCTLWFGSSVGLNRFFGRCERIFNIRFSAKTKPFYSLTVKQE